MGAAVSYIMNSVVCILTFGLVCRYDTATTGTTTTSPPITSPPITPTPITPSPITGAPVDAVGGWYLGNNGDNCNKVCQDYGFVCNGNGLENVNNADKMKYITSNGLIRNVQGGNFVCDNILPGSFEGNPVAWNPASVPNKCYYVANGGIPHAEKCAAAGWSYEDRFCCCTVASTDDTAACPVA